MDQEALTHADKEAAWQLNEYAAAKNLAGINADAEQLHDRGTKIWAGYCKALKERQGTASAHDGKRATRDKEKEYLRCVMRASAIHERATAASQRQNTSHSMQSRGSSQLFQHTKCAARTKEILETANGNLLQINSDTPAKDRCLLVSSLCFGIHVCIVHVCIVHF